MKIYSAPCEQGRDGKGDFSQTNRFLGSLLGHRQSEPRTHLLSQQTLWFTEAGEIRA